MQTSTFPSNLQQLLAYSKGAPKPLIAILNCGQSGAEFLMEGVFERLEETFSEPYLFLPTSLEVSKTIKEELKIAKAPVLLVLEAEKIQQIYAGILPYQQLKKSLESYLRNL